MRSSEEEQDVSENVEAELEEELVEEDLSLRQRVLARPSCLIFAEAYLTSVGSALKVGRSKIGSRGTAVRDGGSSSARDAETSGSTAT